MTIIYYLSKMVMFILYYLYSNINLQVMGKLTLFFEHNFDNTHNYIGHPPLSAYKIPLFFQCSLNYISSKTSYLHCSFLY